MFKIAVIDDELPIVEAVRYNLERESFRVLSASNGIEGLELITREKPDLVVLDIMLPEIDGLEICKRVRQNSAIPIIMLTAKGSEVDRVVGLELGADDYITKPFSVRELIARIKAVLRRTAQETSKAEAPESIQIKGLFVNDRTKTVSIDSTEVKLSPKEYEILRLLAFSQGKVFTRDYLLDTIWGYDYHGDSRTVDVHIRWLREKIEADPKNPKYIQTVRGMGYKLIC